MRQTDFLTFLYYLEKATAFIMFLFNIDSFMALQSFKN